MFIEDYHLHSKYSFDGHENIYDICEKAIKEGMSEIAITDHMDIYSNKPYESILNCPDLFTELKIAKEKYKGVLPVKLGIELGQPQVNPKEAKRFLNDYELDFIIGSVHNMTNDIDVADYDFSKLNCDDVYSEYLNWLFELVNNYDFDVLGHITYPLRYMANAGYSVDIHKYEDRIRDLYKLLIDKGKGIELNTSGLYQKINETMPSKGLIKLYKECGGEIITVGSDSHFVKHVGVTVKTGVEIIKDCGFSYITSFDERNPSFHKI